MKTTKELDRRGTKSGGSQARPQTDARGRSAARTDARGRSAARTDARGRSAARARTNAKQRRPAQTEIEFRTWGGKRKGAGRKRRPAGERRVAHGARAKLASRYPVHVTIRMRDDVPRLRTWKMWREIRRVFAHCCSEARFRICQFSVQGNHIHLICEAADAQALAWGMQRFSSMLSRRVNKRSGRKGRALADRYHSKIIKSPRQARSTLCYVLQNARRHGLALPAETAGTDPFSSAWYFDGWRDDLWKRAVGPPHVDEAETDGDGAAACVAAPHTWLLAHGWRRHRLLDTAETPPVALPF